MEATSLQLFVLNQRTLTQWFNRRESTQEISVLTQGLAAEDHIVVASSQLPPPREKLDEAPSPSGLQHEFALPPNRAAKTSPTFTLLDSDCINRLYETSERSDAAAPGKAFSHAAATYGR
ncbi:uncharacterized protein LOC118561880 isoform X3 [Fundulus heteroclitus]|uniref:uncharacterized protein LOC118561880 isoform X3 n=1 Tax=Fundulus heteroclitus TaxID=8078 RepID=UPI00165C0D1D|nr:uncharacterized protein LOC118561880 isoform X3 [Fundulus heteroclitus]